jgi:hypothetical protein
LNTVGFVIVGVSILTWTVGASDLAIH